MIIRLQRTYSTIIISWDPISPMNITNILTFALVEIPMAAQVFEAGENCGDGDQTTV